jgi:hypothetical protein
MALELVADLDRKPAMAAGVWFQAAAWVWPMNPVPTIPIRI